MNNCDGCKLDNRNITHPICIPPPSGTIRGCIISRDPTSEFLDELENSTHYSSDQKTILEYNAPPRWLCKKIRRIMQFPDNSAEMKKLQKFLKYECYWTHMQKCPTKPQNKRIPQDRMNNPDGDYDLFDKRIAESCAKSWFETEFNKHDLKDKIIITLGRDVEYFFKRWSRDHGIITNNKIIHFPHPSGRCRSWNQNADHTKIIQEISQLLKFLDPDVE